MPWVVSGTDHAPSRYRPGDRRRGERRQYGADLRRFGYSGEIISFEPARPPSWRVRLPVSLEAGATESADDLVRDITEVLTSMCARLYGRRAAKNRAARAVAMATGEVAE